MRVPLTILWVDDAQVVQVKTEQYEGYNALQVGCGAKRPKQLDRDRRGHFEKAGVPLKRFLREFDVSPDCLMPSGTQLTAMHFVAGQFVDVSATTIGKGTQVGGCCDGGFFVCMVFSVAKYPTCCLFSNHQSSSWLLFSYPSCSYPPHSPTTTPHPHTPPQLPRVS